MTKSISITCKTGELLEIAKLERFQGDLKEITPEAMDKLKASIIKYGFSFPIFVWQTKILDGHQRLEAAKQLIKYGYMLKGGKLPVVQIEADSDQEAAEKLLLINSRYAQMTQAGFDAFVTDFDIDLSGFSGLLEIPEIDFDFDGGGGFDGNTDPDEVPDVQPDIVSKRGDIWILGEHRLMCGDSTLIDDVEALMSGEKADICFTDPPYGIKMDKGFEGFGGFGGFGPPIKRRQYNDNWDDERPSKNTFELILNNCKQAVIFGGNFFADLLPLSTHWIVWDKKNTMPTFGDCELCWTDIKRISVKKYEFTYNGLIGKEKERYHPTQKPVGLFKLILYDYTKENYLIFEPFSGSGTTIIAAQQTNRRCFALEISERYVDVAVRRWQDFTGLQATLESTGEKFDDIPARRPDNDK